MKKMMMAAMMLLATSTAFAGDSDALKAILKAKTYTEAVQLLNQCIGQITDNAEKAKAYNHLTELALAKVDKEQAAEIENETAKSLGKDGNNVVDEPGLYQAVADAFNSAQECVKYDQLPNAKGKVKPKYANLADRLYMMRGQLINGGVYYQNANDDANAYKYLAEYVETAEWPMFAKFDQSKDANLNDIAYYATYYAYQNKDWAKAEKYVKYAMKSAERAKDAEQLQLAVLGAQLKTHEDSVGYAKKLEAILAQDPENVSVFTLLVTTLSSIGEQAKADGIVAAELAKNPNSYGALVMKGQFESQKKNYEEAAHALEKALPLAADDAQRIAINASIGQCYFYRAQDAVAKVKGVISGPAKAQFDEVYNKAISYLLTAKELDTAKESKRLWAYPLYGCYYFVKGAKAPETEAAAVDAGVMGE